MRILQYNILDGCREQQRFTRFNGWMMKQSYDIVGFNEMNGWTAEEFQRCAGSWGYPHTCLLETKISPYFIGVAAKWPIVTLARSASPFYHGMLHVKINGVHFLLTHMSPEDSRHREQEAAEIARRLHHITEPAVVMGDLNTLSPADREHYERVGLPQRLNAKPSLLRKYMVDGQINFRPMEILLEAGLKDTYEGAFQYSVPTRINGDPMHAAGVRLDYILANVALQALRPQSRIVRDEEVDTLSDHYPVECWW